MNRTTILTAAALLAIGATWTAYRLQSPRPPASAPPSRTSPLAVTPGEPSLVGTTAHPLDHVVIGLRRASGRASASLRASGSIRVRDGATGADLGVVNAGRPLSLAVDAASGVLVARAPGWERRREVLRLIPVGDAQIRLGRARYAGTLVARFSEGRIQFTNEIDVERYLAGVVPGEIPNGFALEAQKALAVAARTYALVKRGKHAGAGFDLCDGTHCQMYTGVLAWAPRGKRAVIETRGLLAWHDASPLHTFYSADCGGKTSNNEDVLLADMPRQPLPYLRARRDNPGNGDPDYCAASPFHQWSQIVSGRALESALNRRAATRIGILTGIRFIAHDRSGRIRRVRIDGLRWSTWPPSVAGPPPPVMREVEGWEFRRSIGWRRLRSTLAQVRRLGPDRYLFSGRGNGHGVGLCQIGANGMANAPYGRSFREILDHYYPGATIAPLANRLGPAQPGATSPTKNADGDIRMLASRTLRP